MVDITTPTEPVVKPDIPKDADSDFAELNPLDDIDVSDQLIRKKQVPYKRATDNMGTWWYSSDFSIKAYIMGIH